MLKCNKCSGPIMEGSIYCPHCGDPVTEADRPDTVVAQSKVAQVQVTFGRSSSANYERALQICRNIASYSETGEGSSILHSVILPITEVELLLNVYELVGSWKSSQMLINGQPATKSALVFHGIGCYRNRQRAYNKEQYCFGERIYDFNIWGCVRLQMPINEWGGGWLDYGMIDKSGIWHFDKDRIRHDLELQIHETDLCPVLDKQRIMDTLNRLPDTINPKADPRWTYKTEYQEIRGEFKQVATGIRPVIKRANTFVIGEFKPDWETQESTEANEPKTSEVRVDLTPPQKKAKVRPQKQQVSCLLMLLSIILTVGILIYVIF